MAVEAITSMFEWDAWACARVSPAMSPTQWSWCGDITHCTHPKYVACTVPLLSGALRQHLEVDELQLTHVFARIIVEVEVHHHVGPARLGRVIEVILRAANSHLV